MAHEAEVSSLLLGICFFFLTGWLSSVPVPEAPRLGHRGEARARAVAEAPLFAACEPVIRWISGVVALLPIDALRAHHERALRRANHFLGLAPNELIALDLLSGFALGAIALALCLATSLDLAYAGALAALGFALPTLRAREIARGRTTDIVRGLPHAIEVAAMCMSAGLDFVGALRLLAASRGKRDDALSTEFSLILEELELGHTRREALLAFADRVPATPVRDFVLAVVQAEQRGNPLSKVLQVQGRMLNLRRTVAAEEAAARAGVLLAFPMVLMLGCILMLLIGPFFASSTQL